LHFETRFYDAPINPEEIIDFKNQELRDENLFIHRGLFRPGASVSNDSGPVASSVSTNSSAPKSYHKVRSGDTLGAIARKYGTTVSRLCQLNGIRPTTTLQIGQSLKVR
jgi:LysM repeat protein